MVYFCAFARSEIFQKKRPEIRGGLRTIWCKSQWVNKPLVKLIAFYYLPYDFHSKSKRSKTIASMDCLQNRIDEVSTPNSLQLQTWYCHKFDFLISMALTHWLLHQTVRDPPLISGRSLKYFRASESTKINHMRSNNRHKIRFQDFIYLKFNKWTAKY